MRRCLLGLTFLLGLGCAGRNTVAGEDKTRAEQLEEAVPSWCESICQRLGACSVDNGCDCTGDVCSCSGIDDDCPQECQQEMQRFTAGDEECAAVGLRFKSCLDGLTCEQFASKNVCQLSEADKSLCPDDPSAGPTPGDVPPTSTGGSPTTSSGSAGSAAAGGDYGSGTGGTGSAGASSGGASSSGGGSAEGGASGGTGSGGASGGPPVDCSAGYGSAGSGSAGSSAGGTPSSLTCEEGRDSCNDGRAYNWVCAQGSQGQTGCTCFVDSQVTGGFDPGSVSCPSLATVNAGCGWNLTQ